MHSNANRSELERQRLEHREQRIERVLAALHDRAVYRGATSGEPPRPLRHAIADFARELQRTRHRLTDLTRS
jgi:hypothetical protein